MTSTEFRTRTRTALGAAGDVVGLLALLVLIVWMAFEDGGHDWFAYTWAALFALVAIPVAAREMRHVPPVVRILLAWWATGILVAFAFALDRNFWITPTLTYATVPVVGLLAHRMWRHDHGPRILLSILLVAASVYIGLGTWRWLQDTGEGIAAVWRPLSWHNQSGTLMGAWCVVGAALASARRRWLWSVGVFLTGLAAAGLWQTGSRGALAATAIGLFAVAVGVVRRGVWRRHGPRLAAAALLAIAVVASLQAAVPNEAIPADPVNFTGTSASPIANRGSNAVGNFEARLRHMRAAIGMFADHPLTGEGLGSYRNQALDHTPRNANLTASAHDEYAEVLGEGGLVLGVPFLLLHVLVLGLAIRELGRKPPDDDVRTPLRFGLAAVVPLLALHAAVDFDWIYPVLPLLLALAGGVLATPEPRLGPERGTNAGRTSWTSWLWVVPLAIALAGGIVGSFMEDAAAEGGENLTAEEFAAAPLPWQGDRATEYALTLSRRGEHRLAAELMQEVLAWNPGPDDYRTAADIVVYRAGVIDGQELARRVRDVDPTFGFYNVAAEALIDGRDYDAAAKLLDHVLATYGEYESWGVVAVREQTWYLATELAIVRDGCAAGARTLASGLRAGHVREDQLRSEFGPLASSCPRILERARELQ